MKEIFLFISGAFAGKLIEDNLPNLHYKNLAAAIEKYVMPVLLVAALGCYAVFAKISKDKEVQKNYIILLTILVTAIALQKLAQNKKLAVVK